MLLGRILTVSSFLTAWKPVLTSSFQDGPMREGSRQLRTQRQERRIMLVSTKPHLVRSRTDCPRTDNYMMLKLGES